MNNNYFVLPFITLIFSFFLSTLINKSMIYLSNKNKIHQAFSSFLNEEEIKIKKDVAPLGSISLVLTLLLSSFLHPSSFKNSNFCLLLGGYIFFFFIGFIDDFIKMKFKNYKGLSGFIRIIFELLITIFITYYLIEILHYKEALSFSNLHLVYIGTLTILFFPFIMIGGANSLNLTDGIDGLASSLVLICLLPLISFSFKENEIEIALLLISLFGALLGFIIFNLPPAKIFLGDGGSLPLGMIISLSAIILKITLLLPLLCLIFIFETLSVIIQVLYFKITNKRLFLMAPFHHHLIRKGVSEERVVIIFFVIQFILSCLVLYIGVSL